MGTVEATAERVYLGLGSNVGDRDANLRRGLQLLSGLVAIDSSSSVYDTDPWGYSEQAPFLNYVCGGPTSLLPTELLVAVKEVERTVGRVPTFPNGPRVLDVDILLYGERVIHECGLEIPHPRLAERAFVLAPLREIAGDVRHPTLNLRVEDLMERLARKIGSEGDMPRGVRLVGPPMGTPFSPFPDILDPSAHASEPEKAREAP